jgi:hypothetical protein
MPFRQTSRPSNAINFQWPSICGIVFTSNPNYLYTVCKLACGPPVDLAEFEFAKWVPEVLKNHVTVWIERFFTTIEKILLVGQIGILFGERGLPIQEQHRDHQDPHLVFLIRYALTTRPDTTINTCTGCPVTIVQRFLVVAHQWIGPISSTTTTCSNSLSSAVTP